MVKVRRMFAGSNSGRGFYSFFEYIIGPGARRVFLLKGGPGTGKSRFMKEVAAVLKAEGYHQELFFCSSDANSLDAVAFPDLKVALIDATAPHNREAALPGCRDQLICLDNFWSQGGLVSQRREIEKQIVRRQGFFASAFRYLKAARILEEKLAIDNSGKQKQVFGNGELERLLGKGVSDRKKQGFARHLLAAAITPQGYVNHISGLAREFSRKFILKGPLGTGKSEYLARLAQQACHCGLDVEVFHSPLDPRKILHLLFPGFDLAVLTADHREKPEQVGDLLLSGEEDLIPQTQTEDYQLSARLFQKAVQALQQARQVHLKLEGHYASQMDFEALDRYRHRILEQILAYKNLS